MCVIWLRSTWKGTLQNFPDRKLSSSLPFSLFYWDDYWAHSPAAVFIILLMQVPKMPQALQMLLTLSEPLWSLTVSSWGGWLVCPGMRQNVLGERTLYWWPEAERKNSIVLPPWTGFVPSCPDVTTVEIIAQMLGEVKGLSSSHQPFWHTWLSGETSFLLWLR